MAAFDPDVFGAPAAPAASGFDPDVFNVKPSKAAQSAPIAAPAAPAPSFDLRGEGWDKLQNYSPRDAIGGQLRGAGSIGSTLIRPFESADANQRRRADIDAGLTSLIGSNPESTAYQTNKLLAEVAGTSGLGGAIAKGISMIPGAARALPTLLPAIQSGGMSANGATGAYGMANRVAGGAVNGAAMAGAVDPKDTGNGMMIGGAFPVAAKVLGAAGDAIGSLFKPSTPPNPVKLQTAKDAIDAGYVIPPSMIEPSLKNRVLESTSGKHATAQIAATNNQQVTDDLVRKALNLPADAPLTQEMMKKVRSGAALSGYAPLKATGTVTPGQAYFDALDDIAKTVKSATASFPKLGPTNMHGKPVDEIGQLVSSLKQPQFDAGGAVDAISVLRDNADAAFATGNKALGRANKAAATVLEDALDAHLQQIGAADLLPKYRVARQLIAKTYTAEKGLREGSGIVDARAIGRELQKGKPLTDELLTIGRFGNTFDKAAQPPHLIGSPAVHNLSAMFSTGAGAAGAGLGGFVGGPVGAGIGAAMGAAYPYLVPPIARSIMFSKGAQQGLLNQGGPQGLLGQSIDAALPLAYRTSGLLAGRLGQ